MRQMSKFGIVERRSPMKRRIVAGLAVNVVLLLLAAATLEAPAETQGDTDKLVAAGKAIFFDKSLSNPPGMACATCHDPETGFSYSVSMINRFLGTVPGIVRGRFGNRKPPSLAYAPFLGTGLPHYDQDAQAFVGGLFWDGRAKDAVTQVKGPFLNPNEMNNSGIDAVIRKIQAGPSGKALAEAYGANVFKKPPQEVFELAAKSLAAFEASPEVSPFSSKYDAYLEGKAQLSPDELLGLRLCTGTLNGRPNSLPFRKSAHCMDCHALSPDLSKSRDLWTNSCYANLGVPRNPWSPYYGMADSKTNPNGFNRNGSRYVDMGLGAFLNLLLGEGVGEYDPLRINGTFKAPSLRNVDKRPSSEFEKCYMHNGVFKSLKQVVHFYNTRNLTTFPGEVIDFTKPNPYEGLRGSPLWARPEYLNPNTLINPTGIAAGAGSRRGTQSMDLDAQQIGNLGLSEIQENAIVAFLKTLSDGYYKPVR